MKEAVFHFCAMAQLDAGRTAYTDGCVLVPDGGALDLDRIRVDAANAMAASAGGRVAEAGKLKVILMTVPRVTP